MVGDEIETLHEKVNWHWRNTMHPVRFFSFDARAGLPLPLLLIYFRPATIILTIITLLIFRFLERKGLTFPAAIRSMRTNFAGKERPGLLGAYNKKFQDFG